MLCLRVEKCVATSNSMCGRPGTVIKKKNTTTTTVNHSSFPLIPPPMGNFFGNTTHTAPRPHPPPLHDRPYLWAIRDPEQLDWKTSKTPDPNEVSARYV